MREILFRGKCKNSGEWVYGNLFNPDKADTPTQICIGTYTEKTCYEIDPETVGEFTGVTDKNGRKIFEGDIVRERGGESCQGYYEIDNVLTVKIPDTLINFEMSYDCEYKIIGNIYDNPELMKGGNNNG